MRSIGFFNRMPVGALRDDLRARMPTGFDGWLAENGRHLIDFRQLCNEPILEFFELGFDLVEFLERALVERFAVPKPLLETHCGCL